jgi:hypothetical protein
MWNTSSILLQSVPRGTLCEYMIEGMFHVEHSCGKMAREHLQLVTLKQNALMSSLHRNLSLQMDNDSAYSASGSPALRKQNGTRHRGCQPEGRRG